MKNIGCGSIIFGLIVFGMLINVAKDPVGGPILLITVIGIIGTIAYLVLKPSKKNANDFLPGGQSANRAQTEAERKAELLQNLSKKLPNSGISPIPLKAGEELIYKIYQVSLIESRSNGSSYQGGSQGVSIRIAKGLSYRVGASKGQLVKNPETMQVIDQGTATFTNKRLIFAGTKASREWSFEKMTDVGQSAEAKTIMLSVSNRQKPSGITASDSRDIEPGILIAIALEYNQNGLQAAKDRCLIEAGIDVKPKLEILLPAQDSAQLPDLSGEKANLTSSRPPKRYGAQVTQPARIDQGEDIVDVVGESFYAESFATLRERYNVEYGETEDFDLELVAEPFNKYSKNGHAVAVQLDGLVLGHIAEDENTEFFDLLKETNGRAKCSGEIYFAPNAEVMKNSVRLYCDYPPELADGSTPDDENA